MSSLRPHLTADRAALAIATPALIFLLDSALHRRPPLSLYLQSCGIVPRGRGRPLVLWSSEAVSQQWSPRPFPGEPEQLRGPRAPGSCKDGLQG